MTAVHWPWSHLEIAPTEDRKTIREAYSRLLKALDHEAETEAYMDLRDARDAALSGEFLHPPEAHRDEEPDDFGLGDPLPEGAILANEAPPAQPEARPVFTVEYSEDDDKRFQRVVDLFVAENDPTREEALELRQHLDILFADDRMGDLGHYARVEAWLAQLLAERHPRGADLFPRISAYFNWADRVHELGIHPAIPWLFNAHDGLRVVREIEDPGHAYHREWTELTRGKPEGMLWMRRIDNSRMANLIATIRRDYPWLEGEHWQPALVERWEKKSAGGETKGPGPWTWIGLFVLFASAVSGLSNRSADPGVAPTPTAYSQTSPDAAVVAYVQSQWPQAIDEGRDPSLIRADNPELFEQMEEIWTLYKDNPSAFNDEMAEMLVDQYFGMLRRMPFEVQMAEIAQRRLLMRRIGDNPAVCANFIRDPADFLKSPVNSDQIPQPYRYHIYSAVYDYSTDLPPIPQRKPRTYSPDLLAKIAANAGLAESVVRDALESNLASERNLCAATRALYDVVVELPEAEARSVTSAIF